MSNVKRKYISNFLDIPSSIKEKSNINYQKYFHEILKRINNLFTANNLTSFGIYVTGSATIEDVIITNDGKFKSDLDIVIIVDEKDLNNYRRMVEDLNLSDLTQYLKIDVTITSPDRITKLTNIASIRLEHYMGNEYELKINNILELDHFPQYILYITPDKSLDGYLSNLKFIKRALEILFHDFTDESPNMKTLSEQKIIKPQDQIKIQQYFSVYNPPNELIYEFAIYFLKTYLIKNNQLLFSHKDVKAQYVYNSYLNILLSKENFAEEVENSPFMTSDIQNISMLNQLYWSIHEGQKVKETLQYNEGENQYKIFLNSNDTSFKEAVFNVPQKVSFMKVSLKELTPLFLKILSQSKEHAIPLEVTNLGNLKIPSQFHHRFLSLI